MKRINAYGYRDPANAFLPRDVLAALNQPPHVKQGSLVVFAKSSLAAWRRLGDLDMAPSSYLQLAQIAGPRIRALIDAGLDYEHGTYAMPTVGGDVVELLVPNGVRVINHIGRIDQGVFVSNVVESAELEVSNAVIEVTDAMVDAFSVAYEGRHTGEAPIRDAHIRTALAAALKARTES